MKHLARFGLILATACFLLTGGSACGDGTTITLNVSAAASLTAALDEINRQYELTGNTRIQVNYASSGTLQTQIEQGAPVDVFISAAARQMDTLENKGLVFAGSRRDLLNNRVVLIVPDDSSLIVDDFSDLLDSAVGKIAMGDPNFVPAGTYAKAAFEFLGTWQQIEPKLILGSDVRQVLNYVENGNVDAGLLYATDASLSQRIRIAATAP
ncbi:MAG: molybdate ABC transporter substrate-binding protein, partial [Dehalococcoidaceae bacterium]|nr:molybdate ABC transporter substrate-binding protein [Dehalococcoidaceae bacterium]